MQDIKSLYLEAKRTGSQKSIDAYTEAINDLISNNPAGYISNLEYIISSSSGLQTLHEFVEKNGMPLACVDSLEACLEKCIQKCEDTKKDPKEYQKVLESVQNARAVYDESFAMFEYYKDRLPANYVETYYGKNPSGIPNRKLLVGMIEKFGEACIPDMIQAADSIGESALSTALDYISGQYLQEKNDPILSQWVYEAAKTTHLYKIPDEKFKTIFSKMYEGTIGDIVTKMRDRKNHLYQESVIMADDSIMMEYSQEEIKAIEDLISIKEYQMVATPSPRRATIYQEEVYGLYEELDGLATDTEEEFTEKTNVKKVAAAKIAKNMKSLALKIKKAIGPEIHKAINDANYKKGTFQERIVTPSVRVTFGDKKGPFTFGSLGIKKKVQNNLNEIVDFSSEWIKGIAIYIELTTETGAPIGQDGAQRYWNAFLKGINAGLKDMLKDGDVSLTGNEPNNYVSYITTWRVPVFMSKSAVIEDVDLDFEESSQEFQEMIADSVIPMLPGSGHDITEAQWLYNTMNKKTGAAPGYLSNNHDLGYGEDEPEKKPKKDKDYTLDDFKRPSAGGTQSHSPDPDPEPEEEPKEEPDPERTDKPVNGVNNYYYYTYNNSLNRNQGSFNRTHSVQDDHSTGKRIDSDDNNSHNVNPTPDKSEEEDDKKEAVVERVTDEVLTLALNCIFNEYLQDIQDNGGYFSESGSNSKFKYAYKAAYNYDNGHALKITYSLDNIIVTDVGDLKPLRDEALVILKKYAKTASDGKPLSGVRSTVELVKDILMGQQNIQMRKRFITELLNQHLKDIGYVDFQAKNCEIIEIYDRADKVKITDKIRTVGVYAAAEFNKERSLILSDYAMDRMKARVERRNSRFKIIPIKVGDIQKVPTFMTTHWDDHADKGLVDSNGKVISDDEENCDNSSQIQSAKEFHGYDVGQDGTTLLDAFSDFIDPTKDIFFAKGRESVGKFEKEDSNKRIDKQKDFVENIKKAIGAIDDEKDSKKLQKLLDEQTEKLKEAKELLKLADYKGVFDALSSTDKSIEEFKKILNKLSEKYDKLSDSVDSTYTEAVGDADDNKPESDHPVKDVLTDIDRAIVSKQQDAKKVIQDAQNVGRVFMKPINRTTQWIGNMINQWKDVDENNIKERMADPHARKNIFTAVGTAIKYGSLLKAGLLLNPVFLFLSVTKGVGRHKREFRIRNEMIGELKTELKVIDEKIKDADSAGDKKAKYQLMRLKNEINKKLVRVGGDKQWKKIL